MKPFLIAASLVAGLGLLAAPALAAEDPTEGLWVNNNGWVVEVAPCEGGVCGTVVAVGGGENARRFDDRNADPALRDRPLCGIHMFGGFEPAGTPGEWESGWVYNPQDGKTYNANLEPGDGDTLEVRGYILTPMIGRTVTLQRHTDAIDRCSPEEFAADTPPAPPVAAP